jgi:hypothetical protein
VVTAERDFDRESAGHTVPTASFTGIFLQLATAPTRLVPPVFPN